MVSTSILQFLKGVKKNNNKAWLDTNRSLYESSKAEFLEEVDAVIRGIVAFDKSFMNLTPKECIFRLNRDVRFSKEKHPYKTNYAAYFNPAGKKGAGAGYYMHVEPGKSFAAVGLWDPPTDHLAAIRQEIDYNLDEWKKIINDKNFKKVFNNGFELSQRLVRAPKGYDENNPAIEHLKMKNFVVSRSFSDEELQQKKFTNDLVNSFKAGKAMTDFINRAID
jgi:uncharacterized protein (TIGR02453 family)